MTHLNRSIFSNKSSEPTCTIHKIALKYTQVPTQLIIKYNVHTDHSIVQGSGQCPQFQDVTHMDYLHASCILLKRDIT